MSTDEEKVNRWREHFESVLYHIVSSDVPLFAPTTETISPQTPPSKSEIVSAIKSIPSGKAAEIDKKPVEFYKSKPYMAAEVLQPLEEAWLSEAFPEEWTDVVIVKIPKRVICRHAIIGEENVSCPQSPKLYWIG